MEKKRIEFIDLAKGVCILLVVLGHLVPIVNLKLSFIFCIRMPLYFCLSGLFFKDYGGLRNFTIKKVNKILVPFIFWYIASYIFYYLGATVLDGNVSEYHYYDIFVKPGIFNVPIWFLLCLFWSNLIFFIIKAVCRNERIVLAGVLAATCIGWAMIHYNVFNFLYIGSAFSCMPFFYMGYLFKRSSLLYPGSSKTKDILIMTASLVVALLFAFSVENPPRLLYLTNEVVAGNPITIYCCAVAFVTALLLICKLIGRIPFIVWLGRYSIIVLVTHILLRVIYFTLLNKLLPSSIAIEIKQIADFCLVVASMLIVIPFCKRYLPYVTAQKDIFGEDGIVSVKKLQSRLLFKRVD